MRSCQRRRHGHCIPILALLLSSQIHCFVPNQNHVSHLPQVSRKRARWNLVGPRPSHRKDEHTEEDRHSSPADRIDTPSLASRRTLLLQGALLAAGTALPLPALAGKPELDKTGELYSPKAQMLRGGSDAARGIEQRKSPQAKKPLPGQAIQSVYETRFLAYLTRFLLTFDPAAHAWWVQQGFQDSWEQELRPAEYDTEQNAKFAEFAESVEVGLADYFLGPYGSYASVSAAKAGILATAPAASARPKDEWQEKSVLERLGFEKEMKKQLKAKRDKINKASAEMEKQAREKQGILNLYALLKARYTSNAAKRQLAILFSFITDPDLQPSAEIRSLLGEADDANVTKIEFVKPQGVDNEGESRTSSRRGGGYCIEAPPKVEIEPPPALGDEFREATCSPIMRPTSRILRINVTDGGEGYKTAPVVSVQQSGSRKQCEACAILDRSGHVETIIVLNPGYGYGRTGKGYVPPKVIIEPPKKPRTSSASQKKTYRTAKAVAELEYEIVGINLVQGGNGFVATDPPKITITKPEEDPDWYVSPDELYLYGGRPSREAEKNGFPIAWVTDMTLPDGSLATSIKRTGFNRALIDLLRREPLELLPSSIRPEPVPSGGSKKLFYDIPSLPAPPPFIPLPSPRYRAFDPIFGGVGAVPVQRGASELSASEYWRLALSGAVCTVVVRTALNPLELVKTKIQLKNDKELNEYAYKRMKERSSHQDTSGLSPKVDPADIEPLGEASLSENGTVALKTREAVQATATTEEEAPTLGTIDLIRSIVELRGPLALFQSADITFLASLVFGSFGFGATELFRRSFTSVFFTEGSGDFKAEIVLLTAAALATVLTSAAASPFEVLRVRSMGVVEAKPWKDVLKDFLEENAEPKQKSDNDASDDDDSEFRFQDLRPADVLPLWKGFLPTVSRELPFAVAKFLAFDLIARTVTSLINSQAGEGAMPVQVGVGTTGLAISAFAGAIAGIAGAFVSHPADLILTLTSSASKKPGDDEAKKPDWRELVQELLSRPGGITNLFTGLPARSVFFFLVIGLQFFLYDYVKTLFQVGSDDLELVLDVFYAVRQGLVDIAS